MRFLRSGSLEVLTISMKDTVQLPLVKDEQVIQTLATHTAQEAFADRIGPWRLVGRFQYLDATCGGHARETGSKCALTIAHEVLRRLSIGSCLAQLLSDRRHKRVTHVTNVRILCTVSVPSV